MSSYAGLAGSTSSGLYARIYAASDPADAWESVIDTSYYDRLCGIASDGEVWSATGTHMSSYKLCVFTNAAFKLPTISVDGVYTYIKAKE